MFTKQKFIKRFIKRTLKMALLVFLVAFLYICYLLNCSKLPNYIHQNIITALQNNGYNVNCEQISLGVFTGIELQTINYQGKGDDKTFFLSAKKIYVETNLLKAIFGELAIKTILISDGDITIQAKNREVLLDLNNISIEISNNDDFIQINNLFFTFENLEMDLNGKIVLDKNKKENDLMVENHIDNVIKIIDEVHNCVKRVKQSSILKDAKKVLHKNDYIFSEKVSSKINFTVFASKPQDIDAEIFLSTPKVNKIQTLNSHFSVKNNSISCNNLFFQLNETEFFKIENSSFSPDNQIYNLNFDMFVSTKMAYSLASYISQNNIQKNAQNFQKIIHEIPEPHANKNVMKVAIVLPTQKISNSPVVNLSFIADNLEVVNKKIKIDKIISNWQIDNNAIKTQNFVKINDEIKLNVNASFKDELIQFSNIKVESLVFNVIAQGSLDLKKEQNKTIGFKQQEQHSLSDDKFDTKELTIANIENRITNIYQQWVEFKESHKIKMLQQNNTVFFDVQFDAALKDLQKSNIKIFAQVPQISVDKISISQFKTNILYENQVIKISQLTADINTEESLAADIDFNIEDKQFSVEIAAHINPKTVFDFAEKIDTTLAQQINVVENLGAPAQITIKIPTQKFSFTPKINLEIAFEEMKLFDKILMYNAKAKASWDFKVFEFDIEEAIFNQSVWGKCQGKLMPEIHEFYMNAQVIGNPDFAEPFIASKVGQKNFVKICNMLKWKNDSQPTFDFALRNSPNSFQLYGDISGKNFELNNLPIKDFSTFMLLEIEEDGNQMLLFNNFNLLNDLDEKITGIGAYHFPSSRKDGYVNFDAKSTISPKKILQYFDLSLDVFNNFNFSGKVLLDGQGLIDVDFPEKTSMLLHVESDKFFYDKFKLENVAGKISYSQNIVTLEKGNIEIFDGIVNGNFAYNFADKSFYLNGNVINIALNNKNIPAYKSPDAKLNLSLHQTCIKITDDNEIYEVFGNGKIRLFDGNFWHFPIISPLKKLLKASDKEKITKINADYLGKGEIVSLANVRTNGQFLALKGNGDVNLKNSSVKATFDMVILDRNYWRVVGKILSPLTNRINLNLEGPFNNLQWSTSLEYRLY